MSGIVGGNLGRGSGLIKAGAIDDNAVTLAKMAGLARGNLIYGDSSGDPAALAVGSANEVLTHDGTDFDWAAAGGASAIDDLSDGTTTGTNNIGLGSAALDSLTSGYANISLGSNAGTAISSGHNNVSIGNDAGAGTTIEYGNVAIGGNALDIATTYRTTAIGYNCMTNLTTAQYNVGVGYDVLQAETDGVNNTAVGYRACASQVSVSHNTGMGFVALQNSTGHTNTGFGSHALQTNTSGDSNTAVGGQAGYYNTTGTENAFIGGDVCNGTSATASNEFTLGGASVASLRCNDTTISSLSDERDKTNITDLPDSAGLDLINSLRPVTYYWDRREWYDDGVTDGSKVMPTYRSWKPNSGLRQGFIAQEVQTAISGEKCLEDSMVVSGTEDKKEFAPQHLLTNAIKAIQQLSAEVETLKAKVATLEGV